MIEKIEKDEELEKDKHITAKRNKPLKFLYDMIAKNIDNEEDARKYYLKDIFDYKKELSKGRVNTGGRPQRIKGFINDIEYIVFGPLFSPEEEIKKFDIATGGYDPDERIPMPPPELESEEDAGKRQKGQGLKIMTTSQLITRLPILLTQKQAGNNSNKLKNEIRQIIYSLYRSKNLSKTLYNHLINST